MRQRIVMLFCSLGFCLLVADANSQGYKKYLKDFLKTQWWLGVKLGINYTHASPVERFTGIAPINYPAENLEKQYNQFNLASGQSGLDITFYHKGISMGIQPTYRRLRYSYGNDLVWEGAAENERFQAEYKQEQKLDYIDIPVVVKYDFLNGKLRPFLMGGLYYSVLVNAEKSVRITEFDSSSGTVNAIEVGTLNIGVKNTFDNKDYGILAGGGISLDFWNVRGILELAYRHGLNNVADESNRYGDSQLTGIGDVNDDIKLRNAGATLSLVFPLRFISSDLKAF